MPLPQFKFITCLCKLTETQLWYFKISLISCTQFTRKSAFFSTITYLDPLSTGGLLPCHRQSHAHQRLLWNNLVSGKERRSPQKPLSIPIKLHCYVFNKGSLRTTAILWLFPSCAKPAHSVLCAIWTVEPNRVGHVSGCTCTLLRDVWCVSLLCMLMSN